MATGDDEVIIGLDIGMTYSKVAYAASTEAGPHMCLFEQCLTASESWTVPTAICYDDRSTPVGWGYDLVPGAKRLRLFKYSLLHEDDWHPDAMNWSVLADSVRARKQLQMTTVNVLVDYINHLWRYCAKQVGIAQGTTHDICSLRLVITLPGGWSHHHFQQAFNKSMLSSLMNNHTLILLTEAEAAANTILDMVEKNKFPGIDLQIDDSIMVVDCGGLTVDTIVGAVTTSGKATLEFQPVTSPVSELCGASLMTDSFVRLLEDKAKVLLDTPILDSKFWETAVQRWETEIMPDFSPTGSQTWSFRLPPASLQVPTTRASQLYSRWIERGELPLFSQEVSSILDFAVDRIVRLIQAQIEDVYDRTGKCPKYLFATGGFFRNTYLYAGIRNSVKSIPVFLLKGASASLAVARGAAIHGLRVSRSTPFLHSVLAKHDYGIVTDGNLVRLVSKAGLQTGEYMMDGMIKRIALPWGIIESACASGDGTVRLRICRIADIVEAVHIVTWRPKDPVSPNDEVAVEICWKSGGNLTDWAFWQNGLRQSGDSYVSDEGIGTS